MPSTRHSFLVNHCAPIGRLLTVVLSLVPLSVQAGPVTIFPNQTAFENSTAALNVPIPDAATAFPGGGTCGDPGTGIGGSFSIGFASNSVTISNPMTGALCIFNAGAVINNNTNPHLMIANTVVGNGEDDFSLKFDKPVSSIGLRLLTNDLAHEQVTFFGAGGNVIDVQNIDGLTQPNTRQFVSFRSTVPFQSILIDTAGGAVQNEGFDVLEVGTRVTNPEPSTILLLGTGVIAFSASRYARRKWR